MSTLISSNLTEACAASLCLSSCREQFENILLNFSMISMAPNWTFVFCSLPSIGMIECATVALAKGYKVDVFIWNKPDMLGKSHAGGPRQAVSSEFIVVVYKLEGAVSTLKNHYALLSQKEKLQVLSIEHLFLIASPEISFCLRTMREFIISEPM